MSGAGSLVNGREADARVAVEVKSLQAAGKLDEARKALAGA